MNRYFTLCLFVLTTVVSAADAPIKAIEKALEGTPGPLQWLIVQRGLNDLKTIESRLALAVEEKAWEKPTLESVETVIRVYVANRELRVRRLAEKPESTAFQAAVLAELRDPSPKSSDDKGSALIQVLGRGDLTAAAQEEIRKLTADKSTSPEADLLALALFQHRTAAETALKSTGSLWESRILRRLHECAGANPGTAVADTLRDACSAALAKHTRETLGKVTVPSIVGRLTAPASDTGAALEKALPDHPMIKRDDLAKSQLEVGVFAVPDPQAQIKLSDIVIFKGKAVKGSAIKADILTSLLTRSNVALAPPIPSDATSAEMITLMRGSDDLQLSFAGSDDNLGCHYHRFATTARPADSPGATPMELGINTDAYARTDSEVKGLKFWIGATYKPAPNVQWIAVRWKGDPQKAPLEQELTTETKWNLLSFDRDVLFDRDFADKNWKYMNAMRNPEREFELFMASATRNPNDPSRPGVYAFWKLMESFKKSSHRYTPASSKPFRCADGCVGTKPVAVEPGTGWAIFRVRPNYRGAVLFDVEASPLVIHRHSLVHSARGGFTPLAFQVLPIVPARQNFRFGRVPLLEPATVAKNGLLAYVETLSSETIPGGWLRPSSQRIELDALQAMIRLHQLVELQAVGGVGLPANETKEVPWKGRLAVASDAMPELVRGVFSQYALKLEQQIFFLGARRHSALKVRNALRKGLEAEDTLSENDAYVLLTDAMKTLRMDSLSEKTARPDLITSLRGAYFKLDKLSQELEEKFALSCAALERMQFEGNAYVPKFKSNPETLKLCVSR